MHIRRSLDRYLRHELPPAERQRVQQHLARCAACREALQHESRLTDDLRHLLRQKTTPKRGQLSRLLPAVLSAARMPRRVISRLGSYRAAFAVMIVSTILTSAILGASVSAVAAPLQPIPAEVQATWTPIVTEPPVGYLEGTDVAPLPSLAAYAPPTVQPPGPSPVPPAARNR